MVRRPFRSGPRGDDDMATDVEPDAAEISVSIPGDFNGDDTDDIAVGDPDAYVLGSGRRHVSSRSWQDNFPSGTTDSVGIVLVS